MGFFDIGKIDALLTRETRVQELNSLLLFKSSEVFGVSCLEILFVPIVDVSVRYMFDSGRPALGENLCNAASSFCGIRRSRSCFFFASLANAEVLFREIRRYSS